MRSASRTRRIAVRPRSASRRPGIEGLEPRWLPSTFQVVNTDNSGAGSLRQAILDANAAVGADTIEFQIPGAGVHVITPATPLPATTGPVTIDGFVTQDGASPNTLPLDQGDDATPRIVLDGSAAGDTAAGLTISGGDSTVRGLVIGNFKLYGILLEGTGNDHIEGNFIGTDATGLVARPNGTGILADYGVADVTIGGPDPGQRNVISGNSTAGSGREVSVRGNRTVIQGNYMGFGADGSTILGVGYRLSVGGLASTVGGTAAGMGNVFAGGGAGISFDNNGSNNRVGGLIQGNKVGVNAAGTATTYTNGAGINLSGWTNVTIGGTAAGAGNIIGFFNAGIFLDGASATLIQGNAIGTDPTGTLDLGGGSYGIFFKGAHDNTVGGTAAGAENVIAHDVVGVSALLGSDRNAIVGNSIFANSDKAIDHGKTSLGGGENSQAAPTLTSVTRTDSSTTVLGTLDSLPGTAFTIQLYASDSCGPMGYGPGQRLVGTVVTRPSDGSGHVAFELDLLTRLADGQFLSATAMDPSGNTSEFSFDAVVGSLIVRNTDDDGPGSLREAIDCANMLPGANTIGFAIAGDGVQVIRPASALPTITEALTIDGYTQPGAAPATAGGGAAVRIVLDGSSAGGANGLHVAAGGSVIRGLAIGKFSASGIWLDAPGGDAVEGNFIGVDPAGNPLPNSYNGVLISAESSHNTVGGLAAGAANVIAGNTQAGVAVLSGQGNSILSNSIFDDASLGIDLGGNGPSANDPGDTDSGPNGLQNTPVITSATNAGPTVRIIGTLNATPLSTFTVQLYDAGDPDVSGFGQGRTLLGTLGVTTDKDGNGTFDARFNVVGGYVSATATDSAGNTSEFAKDVLAGTTPADVGIRMDAPPGPLAPGSQVTYTLTLHNAGHGDAVGLNLTDTLPAGAQFVSASDGGTFQGGKVTWNIPELDAGAPDVSRTLVIRVNPGASEDQHNEATVRTQSLDNDPDNDQADATTTIDVTAPPGGPPAEAIADLGIEIEAPTDPVPAGSKITYALHLTNDGPGDASGVLVTDTLPPGAQFVSASDGGTFEGGKVTWNINSLPDLLHEMSLTLVVRIADDATGNLRDSATISAQSVDHNPGNNQADATTEISIVTPPTTPSADLSVLITEPSGPIPAGQDARFLIAIRNAGPDPAEDASIVISVPQGVDFVSVTGGATPATDGTLTIPLGSLPAGTTSLDLVLKARAGTSSFTAAATVSSTTADPVATNNAASLPTTVPPADDGPTITAIQRYGYHDQPTLIVLVTSGGTLDAARVADTSNYSIVSAGRDNTFGTRDDVTFHARIAAYDAASGTITLSFRSRLYLYRHYRVRVNSGASAGLADTAGRALDGDLDGTPGGDYRGTFSKANLAGRSIPRPSHAAKATLRGTAGHAVKHALTTPHPGGPARSSR